MFGKKYKSGVLCSVSVGPKLTTKSIVECSVAKSTDMNVMGPIVLNASCD